MLEMYEYEKEEDPDIEFMLLNHYSRTIEAFKLYNFYKEEPISHFLEYKPLNRRDFEVWKTIKKLLDSNFEFFFKNVIELLPSDDESISFSYMFFLIENEQEPIQNEFLSLEGNSLMEYGINYPCSFDIISNKNIVFNVSRTNSNYKQFFSKVVNLIQILDKYY